MTRIECLKSMGRMINQQTNTMRKHLLLWLLMFASVIFINPLYSQLFDYNEIVLTQQSEVDSFQVNYPEDKYVTNSIRITGDDITNLHGLSSLTRLYNILSIENTTMLEDLQGLQNIKESGLLWIYENSGLNSLTGLEGLEIIKNAVYISTNDVLADISGLSSLQEVGSKFTFKENPKYNATGDVLSSLKVVDGDIIIRKCESLTNFSMLMNLNEVLGDFEISHNYNLVDLSSLKNLTKVNGALTISRNSSLKSLRGLGKIEVIESLTIYNNDELLDLVGIKNMNIEHLIGLFIFFNDKLTDCAVKSICDHLNDPKGVVQISDNPNGCQSVQMIKYNCKFLDVPECNESIMVQIVPNPATNYITITNSEIGKIQEVKMLNTDGKKVMHLIDPPGQINISILNPGIYLVNIVTEKRSFTRKLLVQ